MRSFVRTLSILVLACALIGSALAQDKGAAPKKEPTPEEMQKMMQDYMKIAAPGPHHKIFDAMVGDFAMTGKIWMGPGAPAQDMDPGTEKGELILGGRYLRTSSTGQMMGMPYHGEGTLAYDNFRQKYLMSYLDDMGTTISTAIGDYNDSTKTLTMMGKMDDPVENKKDVDVKYVYRFPDAKTTVLEMWYMVPGKSYKNMEITYVKK